MINKFDTKIQELKYEVLKELIRRRYEGDMSDIYTEIPKKIVPGPKATMRCCIYKERAILQERIKLGLGGDKSNPNVIEVIDEACDECPVGGIYVTPACRGCLNHMCMQSCPKGAITIVNNKPVIDREKCIECGKCVQSCPYNAIIHQQRPCVQSCKVKAITMNEEKKARIDMNKCIMCGACVYQCPFGAIQDKSFIMECIDILQGSKNNTEYKVHAVIAPAIVSQFKYAAITSGYLFDSLFVIFVQYHCGKVLITSTTIIISPAKPGNASRNSASRAAASSRVRKSPTLSRHDGAS